MAIDELADLAPGRQRTVLDLPLTGDRSYIHGADIFDALVRSTGADTDIVVAFKAATDCAIELVDAEASASSGEICGTFRYACQGQTRRYLLLRRVDRPISTRVAMDEEALVEHAIFGRDSATAPACTPEFSFLRQVTALYVALLERDYPEDYWSIAEIACARLPRADAERGVRVRGRVGGRFWKAAALEDGEVIGHIVLARGRPRW